MEHFPHEVITQWSFVGRLIFATFIGALLGVERSVAGKHAGMRTYALVSLGSCLFVAVGTLASLEFVPLFASVNPLLMAGNVVVGIGFIGAGLAVFRGDHPVELTTAAGLWLAAAVGITVGYGYSALALVSVVLGIIIFSLFAKLEWKLSKHYGTKHEG